MTGLRGIGANDLLRAYEQGKSATKPQESQGNDFGSRLRELVGEVDTLQDKSAEMQSAAIRGEDVEVHEVMIASQQAGLAFSLMLEVRNKLVDAYQEIMRMQA